MDDPVEGSGETPKPAARLNSGLIVGGVFGVAVLGMLVAALAQGPEVHVAGPKPKTPVQAANPVATPEATAQATAQDKPARAPDDPAIRAMPSLVALEDESLTFEASLPEAPAGDPVIAYLRADAERYVQRQHPLAKADMARAAAQKRQWMGPWETKISWTYSAKAGPLASLIGEAFEDTHGAHPNTFFDTHIADQKTGERIAFDEFFLPSKSPSPGFAAGVCAALKVEKRAWIGSETIYDEPILCEGAGANLKLEEAHVALAPSDVPDRFGGVYVIFDAYAVGSHAEGAYEVVVQQAMFAGDLKPSWKKWFEGTAQVRETP